jgi:5'-3' exonuclease
VLHCLDHDWRPAERVAAYAGYKSDRLPDPEELPWQFELLREVLGALGATQVWAEGWEADDAIGTLCEQAAAGDCLEIVTGDRDLLQLVRDDAPTVRVLFTVKGVKELARFDERGVQDKYGVPAARYVDFAILRGDPSDGLPGVSGVGEKTARDLVTEHASLDAIVAATRGLTKRLGERIAAAADYLKTMEAVVPVRRDLTLVVEHGERDDALLDELARRHAIENPVGRLREALDA